jgi:hypothetical protein
MLGGAVKGMTNSSGRQRNYALAMGIVASPDCDAETLSALMSRAKELLNGPPNGVQRELVARWLIEIPFDANGWRVVDELYAFIQARTFVYSVIRRITGQKWRFYSDSGLNDDWICSIAKSLIMEPSRRSEVLEMDNTLSGTASDAWYRFGPKQFESPSAQFVRNSIHASAPDISKIVDDAATRLSAARASAKREARQSSTTTESPNGCSLVLLIAISLVSYAIYMIAV